MAEDPNVQLAYGEVVCDFRHIEAHDPRPEVQNHHHSPPLSWSGGEVTEHTIVYRTCASDHQNEHALIDEYVKAGGKPPWDVLRHYSATVRAAAAECWLAAVQNPDLFTPAPTL